jgi:chromosomal replication initiation ATPase DnaA
MRFSTSTEVANLINVISQETGVSVGLMMSSSRLPNAVWARALAFYFLRQAKWSLSRIGRKFICHHTTVLHSINKVKRALERAQKGNEDT